MKKPVKNSVKRTVKKTVNKPAKKSPKRKPSPKIWNVGFSLPVDSAILKPEGDGWIKWKATKDSVSPVHPDTLVDVRFKGDNTIYGGLFFRVLRKGCIFEGKEWSTNFCLQLLSFASGRGCRNSFLGRFTGRHRLDGQWLSPVFRL